MTRGTSKPTCMAIISVNFTVKDSEKYVYGILMKACFIIHYVCTLDNYPDVS